MVLESIINPPSMEKHPLEMVPVGFFYSSIGLFLALFVFAEYSSLAGVFITTLPLVVIMMNTIKYEEKKDLAIHKETFLIKEHGKALSMFFCLFMGMVVAYSFWFTVLPGDMGEGLFDFQIKTVSAIQQGAGGVGDTINQLGDLEKILTNNLAVLMFCILFSFLYGAGAIFILTLNASVIGVAVGSRVRDYLASCVFAGHADMLYSYFNSSVSITFCYMFHGLFEISAYIVGALAGGIISVAVVNHDFNTKEFWHIIVDSSDLLILSVVLLVVGAFIEAFMTPVICSGALGELLSSIGLFY